MTLMTLNTKLTSALKKYIKDFPHYKTGKMYRSIKFTAKDSGELKITFKSKYYISYLDKGQFVKWFFALPTTKEIIKEYTTSKVKDELLKELKNK